VSADVKRSTRRDWLARYLQHVTGADTGAVFEY
jgi:hypothetical protein